MLFIFKSASTADLIMHEKNGKEILALLGKNPDDVCGIITAEQLPAAIATLQAATLADKRRPPAAGEQATPDEARDEQPVNLAQRALPFIQMLERAAAEDEPIVWGV
jgi:hypothetical protein